MKKDVALGIDIGGTNTAFGFIDREGNYLTEGNIPTAKHEDINDYLKELYLEIEKEDTKEILSARKSTL